MSTLLLAIHVIVAVFLILVVLLQTGKGASMGAAFGGGSNTVFGSRGPASFLSKITTIAAIVFMLTSLTLSTMASRMTKTTVVEDMELTPPPLQEPVETTTDIDPFKTATEEKPAQDAQEKTK